MKTVSTLGRAPGTGEPPTNPVLDPETDANRALADATLRRAVMTLDTDLAAVRMRLADLEAATTLPAVPGRVPATPLSELRQRVAALERRSGFIPGLDPLTGCASAAAPLAPGDASPPRPPPTWADRAQMAVAAALLVALLAWLVRPPARGAEALPRPAAAPTVVARVTDTPRAIPAAPTLGAGAVLGVPGSTLPCLNDGTASCGATADPSSASAPVPPGAWGRDETCLLPDDRVGMAER